MKSIIIFAKNLNIGGIETALVSLIKNINYEKYNITLLLEENKGELLDRIPKNVKILKYRTMQSKFTIFNKVINRLKIILNIIFNYKKYDISICFKTSHTTFSILSRYFGKKSIFWVHANYYELYNRDILKMKEFFDRRKVDKFNKIVFVSKESKDGFLIAYKYLKDKCFVCNNTIDYLNINKLSNDKISEKIPKGKKIILNVSRHDEKQKKLTRLINAVEMLSKDNYNFELWMIGSGEDTKLYESIIKNKKLDKYIKMLGSKVNPYLYYKISDVVVLTSDYEGFPVVCLEAMMFGIPIITTLDVNDGNNSISNNYGLVVEKDEKSIYIGLKRYFDGELKFNKQFDPKSFNNKTMKKFYNIIQ